MGFDLHVRDILKAIPGTKLTEMAHHGRDTLCCGCDAVDNAPEIGQAITKTRLLEAVATGCDTLLDTCHFCHWIFNNAVKSDADEAVRNLHIENYSTYITKAMGKARQDSLFQD